MKTQTRRSFLRTGIATGALAFVGAYSDNSLREYRKESRPNDTQTLEDSVQEPQITQLPHKPEQAGEIEYINLTNRYKVDPRIGKRTAQVQAYIGKDYWNNLEEGLTKQEFYQSIISAPFKQVTTPIFRGFPVFHPGPINHLDLLKEFDEAAGDFIKNTSKGKNNCDEFFQGLYCFNTDKISFNDYRIIDYYNLRNSRHLFHKRQADINPKNSRRPFCASGLQGRPDYKSGRT